MQIKWNLIIIMDGCLDAPNKAVSNYDVPIAVRGFIKPTIPTHFFSGALACYGHSDLRIKILVLVNIIF